MEASIRMVRIVPGQRRVLATAAFGRKHATRSKPACHRRLARSGGSPGIEYSSCVRSWSSCGIEASSASVYGWRTCLNSFTVSAVSTLRPAYITATRSARPAITPMSWVIRMIPVLSSRFIWSSTPRIWAWIVTSSAVVGSSAISSFGLQASAMAIITRWRRPPDSWCG